MDRPKQAYGYFAIDVFLKDIRRVVDGDRVLSKTSPD